MPNQHDFGALVQRVLAGEVPAIGLPDGSDGIGSPRNNALSRGAVGIYPGSFAPRHSGHRALAQHARQELGLTVIHEISLRNIDKPPLSVDDALRRVAQFRADEPLWLTSAPRFHEKARLFPGAQFLVGLDTLLRIADLRYYASAGERSETFQSFRDRGCGVVVYGRRIEGVFCTLSDVHLPVDLRDLCVEVEESSFRADVSSSELRAAGE